MRYCSAFGAMSHISHTYFVPVQMHSLRAQLLALSSRSRSLRIVAKDQGSSATVERYTPHGVSAHDVRATESGLLHESLSARLSSLQITYCTLPSPSLPPSL